MPNDRQRKVSIDNDWRNMLITEKRRTGGDPSFLFEILESIIQDKAWLTLKDDKGNPVGSLERLIQAPPPVGCGMSTERLRLLLNLEHRHERKSQEWRDRMKALRKRLEELLPAFGKQGGDRSNLIYKVAETTYGTSRSGRIRHLKKRAPDIAQKVIAGDLSAAAGVRALRVRDGKPEYRRHAINMVEAQSACDALVKYMPEDVLLDLIDLLVAWQKRGE